MGEQKGKKNICVGLLAHVDAGKTTLSEALLYETGQIRGLGRVDHGNTYLDTDEQEKERGITIFSKQAQLEWKGESFTLLDTPGHVDFSAEMERTLQVLDYAVLVISGTDGVQGHTKTLWRLLKAYRIPAFLFINKMDLAGTDREKLQKQLKNQLSEGCVDFSSFDYGMEGREALLEEIAMCSETLLNTYMDKGTLTEDQIAEAVSKRELYPCFYGSALKNEGVRQLIDGIGTYTRGCATEEKTGDGAESANGFGALVYKIERDSKGNRLTHMKITHGMLRVKDRICYKSKGELREEKIEQIRICSGDRFQSVERVKAGEICAVTGPAATYPGMGLGENHGVTMPILEPVLNYQLIVPQGVNPVEFMGKLRQLEEEDPSLNILWNDKLQEIHVQLMGQVQMEVLERMIRERYQVRVTFGPGNIVYKETIAKPAEGVGHYEPLRHYAEVHLWLEPGEPGSGVVVDSCCSEDVLDLNWQRLITTHILEREHPGVLVGAALTDVRCTIVTGRAHLKHTEGGDFRQATYRAIRQGLKSTENVLLEPVYRFTLEIPSEQLGRAMTDIRNRFGTHESPEYVTGEDGEMAILTGTAPVATMQDYVSQVHAYTKGMGGLTLELKGYDVCHNSAEVVEAMAYDSEADTANPTGSVFCAHGAGFVVPWEQVPNYMHLEYVRQGKENWMNYGDSSYGTGIGDSGLSYDLEQQAERLRELAMRREEEKLKKAGAGSSWELDRELQQIYAREFGMNKEDMLEAERKKWNGKNRSEGDRVVRKESTVKLDKKGNPIYPKKPVSEEFLIVDGYNIIFALEELKELSRVNIDSAKDKLLDMLANYQGYRQCRVMVVFDGYRVKGNPGSAKKYFQLEVIHTKQDETADMYIERMVHDCASKYKITVATNDNLEQLTVLSQGALRMSALGLKQELERVSREGMDGYSGL